MVIKQWTILLLIMCFLVVGNISMSMCHEITPLSGILIATGNDLPYLINVPESNIRFALWNGTTWIELPFQVKQAPTIEVNSFKVNGTLTKGVVSKIYETVSKKDTILVKIPAEIGVRAKSGNWWEKALHLGLRNRVLLQLSSSNTHYNSFIYVYYKVKGRSLPPIYTVISQYSNPANISSVNAITDENESDLTSTLISVIYKVKSLSKPEKIDFHKKTNDPEIYSLDTVMLKKFEKTGFTPQSTSPFYLPSQEQAVTGVILRIEGKAYDDPYARYLQIYINDQKIWSGNGKIVSGSFEYEVDITDKIKWWNEDPYVMNTAKVVLTTAVGYWVVRVYIYVVYNANGHFRQFYSQFAPWYKFERTGFNKINFHAQLPESIVNEPNGAKIRIHAKAYNDPYARYLDLYIDGQKIKRWIISSEATVTYDITSYLLGKSGVTVGLVLTTAVGYWIVDGYIDIKYRPGVAPDSSNYWNREIHPLTERAGNIYCKNYWPNEWIGIFSFDTRTKEDQTTPVVYTGITIKVPSSVEYPTFIEEVEVHIKAKHKYYGYIDSSYFINLEAYKGSESGTPMAADIGSDLLALLSAALSIYSSELAAVAGVASVLIKYVKTGDFSYGRETNGIYLRWTNWLVDVQEKSILYKYEIDWPYLGEYTVEIQVKISMYRFIYPYWYYLGSVSFTDTFTYYNG